MNEEKEKLPVRQEPGARVYMGWDQRLRVQEDVQGSEYQSDRTKQLDNDVKRWASRIFEGIADRIADDASLMRLALLAQDSAGRIETIDHLTFSVYAQVASFDILLRVIPCASS